MLLPGDPQVHMGIEEGGREQAAAALDEPLVGARGERPGRPELGNLPGAHAHVLAAVELRPGIEHVHIAQ